MLGRYCHDETRYLRGTNVALLQCKKRLTSRSKFLLEFIRIDIAKIRQYQKDLRAVKSVFDEPVSTVKARIMASSNSGACSRGISGMV